MNDVWLVGLIGAIAMVAGLFIGVSIGMVLGKRSSAKETK